MVVSFCWVEVGKWEPEEEEIFQNFTVKGCKGRKEVH